MGVLIIGDSMVKYLDKYMPAELKGHNVRIAAFPGAKIEGLRISDLGNRYDTILVHVGTNNVSDGDSLQSCLYKYDCLFRQILSLNPDAKVIVSALIPRCPNRYPCYGYPSFCVPVRFLNWKIGILNAELEKYCQKREAFFFCGTRHSTWEYCLARDGLHPNSRGYDHLAEVFSKSLGTVLERCNKRKTFLKAAIVSPPLPCIMTSQVLDADFPPLNCDIPVNNSKLLEVASKKIKFP